MEEHPINLKCTKTTAVPTSQLNSATQRDTKLFQQSPNIVSFDSVIVKKEIVTLDEETNDGKGKCTCPSIQDCLSVDNCTARLCKIETGNFPINLSRSIEIIPIFHKPRPCETNSYQQPSFGGIIVTPNVAMPDEGKCDDEDYNTRPSILQNILLTDNCTARSFKVEAGEHPIDLSVAPTSQQDSKSCEKESEVQPKNVVLPFETVYVKQEDVTTDDEQGDVDSNSGKPVRKDSLSTDKKFQCPACKRNLKSKKLLKNHLQTDFPSQPCKCTCQYCSDVFATETLLLHHVRSSHTNERFYKCTLCDAAFNLKPVLKAHLITHSTERPYQCSACLKSFQRRGSLKEHMLIHTNKRPFTCSEQGCDKSFSTRKYLVNHRIVHQVDRPHVCNICNNTFKHRSALAHHLITHTTDRPFSCTLCEKTFQMRGSLKEHMQVHNCEGPFICPEPGCDKSFITRRYLSSHQVVHQEDRSNPCPKCNRMYKHKKALARHLKRCQTYDIC